MIRELIWKLLVLFERVPVSDEPKIIFKKWNKGNPFYWCGYYVLGLHEQNLHKKLREKYYTRYTIRGKQSYEFEIWTYYYLTLFWQYFLGRLQGLGKIGSYCTCPLILESLYYENKPDTIFHAYPHGRWKKFKLTNRKIEWKKEKRHWKTYIRKIFDGKI